jgi:2-iminobutanoate/2-iminopropanoate deaminase
VRAAGGTRGRIVKLTFFLSDWADFPAMNAVCKAFFGDTPPARSTIQGARIPAGTLVGADAIAVL